MVSHTRNNPSVILRFAGVLLVLSVTFAVYHGVLESNFISMDDPVYVTHNDYVNQGFSKEGIRWAFDFGHDSGPYWLPLTMMSHMLDCEWFGLNSSMHHLDNLVLHLINVFLLFVFIQKISGSYGKSLFIAALFALHPLNVESVAWISSRKNVLSAFFWLSAMLMYIRYLKQKNIFVYGAVFGLYVLGLMSKASVITLIFSLLLLDIWPFHRFLVFREGGQNVFRWRDIKNIPPVFEKIPFLIFTGLVLYVNFTKAPFASEATTMEAVPLGLRLANALTVYGVYALQFLFPVNLSVYYPYPSSIPWGMFLSALVFFLAMAGASLASFRKKPWIFVAWFWFVGNLVMVSGIIQGGTWPAHADRFMYIPSIGLFILLVWGMENRMPRNTLIAMAVMFALMLGVLTRAQVGYWKDSITLYRHALNVHDHDRASLVNLAFALDKAGRGDEAIPYYQRLIALYPHYAEVHSNLGSLLAAQGDTQEALGHFIRATELKPELASAWQNAGMIFQGMDQPEKAVDCYEKVLKNDPDNMTVLSALGRLLVVLGRLDRAVFWYESSLVAMPRARVSLSYNLACVYALKKDGETALYYLDQAVQGGFNHWDIMDAEPQLDFIRNTPRYKSLMKEAP